MQEPWLHVIAKARAPASKGPAAVLPCGRVRAGCSAGAASASGAPPLIQRCVQSSLLPRAEACPASNTRLNLSWCRQPVRQRTRGGESTGRGTGPRSNASSCGATLVPMAGGADMVRKGQGGIPPLHQPRLTWIWPQMEASVPASGTSAVLTEMTNSCPANGATSHCNALLERCVAVALSGDCRLGEGRRRGGPARRGRPSPAVYCSFGTAHVGLTVSVPYSVLRACMRQAAPVWPPSSGRAQQAVEPPHPAPSSTAVPHLRSAQKTRSVAFTQPTHATPSRCAMGSGGGPWPPTAAQGGHESGGASAATSATPRCLALGHSKTNRGGRGPVAPPQQLTSTKTWA